FILQGLTSFGGCLFFLVVGAVLVSAFRRSGESVLGDVFFSLFHGITFCVSLYAVVVTRLVTVQILVLGGYGVWWALRWKRGEVVGPVILVRRVLGQWPVILAVCVFFTAVLHLLPASENKQSDTFFYLKISESLNASGQENLHTYSNMSDPLFHGVEPYHYTEMWLNALLLKVTGGMLPGIQVFRFVTYTILLVGLFFGFCRAYEVFADQPAGWWGMLLGLGGIFLLPDLLEFLPGLRHYLVYDFESNCLERPNFITVYFYLIPLLLYLKRRDFLGGFYFLAACVASYTLMVVLVPAGVLFLAFEFWGAKERRAVRQAGVVVATMGVVSLFYFCFANRQIGAFYQSSFSDLVGSLRHHTFFVGSTIVTSLAYCMVIGLLYCCVFVRRGLMVFVRENRRVLAALFFLVLVSVVMARVLSYQDNAYQLAFPAYMATALGIFFCWAYFSRVFRGGIFWGGCLLFFLTGYVAFKVHKKDIGGDIFYQNGSAFYGGVAYSGGYLDQVRRFARHERRMVGGYLGDSSAYRTVYYSRRNPNVYGLPTSYILSNVVRSNYEFCLSDSAALFAGIDDGSDPYRYERDYLHAALLRSPWYLYENRLGLGRREALRRFIEEHGLRYLILSGSACEAELGGVEVAHRIVDPATGEIFLILGKRSIAWKE
ncbi:MAG: hypothetical protein JST68_01890, partial [Bacteroidetes bacterium]|nr:hypothetical protein [Bacteroidota bacterium]